MLIASRTPLAQAFKWAYSAARALLSSQCTNPRRR